MMRIERGNDDLADVAVGYRIAVPGLTIFKDQVLVDTMPSRAVV